MLLQLLWRTSMLTTSGHGRYDVLIMFNQKEIKKAVIFEFKIAGSEDGLDKAADRLKKENTTLQSLLIIPPYSSEWPSAKRRCPH